MICKIDIDNTIRDMGTKMVRLYNIFDPNFTKEDILTYEVNDAFPLLKEEGLDARTYFFKLHATDVYLLTKPMEGAVEGMNLLKSMGCEIILATYQPTRRNKEQTLTWLDKYNIPYDDILFTNKERKDIINADFIIDDNPKFLDEDSAKTVCIDWAYNRGREYDYRVKSILEFANIIKNK